MALQEGLKSFLSQVPLFEGFSLSQIDEIIHYIKEISVASDEYIIRENEHSDHIYIIKEGEVKVTKWDDFHKQTRLLASLGVGAAVGEMGVLDEAPRSASVYASRPTKLLVLSIQQLKELGQKEKVDPKPSKVPVLTGKPVLKKDFNPKILRPTFYHLLVRNLAKGISHRLRHTNDLVIDILRRELENQKARIALGILIITIVVNLSLYVVVLKFLEDVTKLVPNSTVTSAPIIAFFAIMILISMIRSGYPLSFYGITLKYWKPALVEGLLISLPIMIATIGLKLWLIDFIPAFYNKPIFDVHISTLNDWLWILVYLVFVPLQELIVRGGLQSSFEGLLVGKRRFFWAVVLSNILFSVIHFHVSIFLGITVFFPGLLWGWMYARYPTLVGVIFSHQITGIFALSIVGIY